MTDLNRREALRGGSAGIVGLIGAASVNGTIPPGTDNEFVRLCKRLVAIEGEEIRTLSQCKSVEDEACAEPDLNRLSDERDVIMSRLKALDLPCTTRGIRALANAALTALAPGEDDTLAVYDYVDWLTASLILAVADRGALA